MGNRTFISKIVLISYVFSACFGIERAAAWVEGYRHFPHGEATVIVHAFCFDDGVVEIGGRIERRCDLLSQQQWQNRIKNALEQWNNAGANFHFYARAALPDSDPCDSEPGHISIILADFSEDDASRFPCNYDLRGHASVLGIYLPFSSTRAHVLLNTAGYFRSIADWAKHGYSPSYLRSLIQYFAQETLLHEFGHAVGLGHPHEAGQDVLAVMGNNSFSGDVYQFLHQDDIDGIRALYGVRRGFVEPEPVPGFLENPTPRPSRAIVYTFEPPDSFQSGVGVISGWVCEADEVLIRVKSHVSWWEGNHPEIIEFLREYYLAAYGTERLDTQEACGDTDNGFGLLFNWNQLDNNGEYPEPTRLSPAAEISSVNHTVSVYADGVLIGESLVKVTTLGQDFLRGAGGRYVLDGFPDQGSSVTIEWSQSLQNFIIINAEQ